MALLSEITDWLVAHRAALLIGWVALGWVAMLPDFLVPLRRRAATDPAAPIARAVPWWRFVHFRRGPFPAMSFAVAIALCWLLSARYWHFWGGVMLGWLPGFAAGVLVRTHGPWFVLAGTVLLLLGVV